MNRWMIPWPRALAEQVEAVRLAQASRPKPATAAEIARRFKPAKADRIAELLETLTALGQARAVEGERFVA